jgi:5-methyltetrahydrofolate--homocysteine methyltransferase
MVHVAREMERRDFRVPLLIGGATTSKLHTAVRIAPRYSEPTVHVLDASRAVGVVSALLGEKKTALAESVRAEYAKLRDAQASREAITILPLDEARRRRPQLAYDGTPPPPFLGARVLDAPLEEIEPFIDWAPFFQAWEVRSAQAQDLLDDGRKLLHEIIEKRLLKARAVYGFWRARANGDDVELIDERRVLHTLRQQQATTTGVNFALADFIAPADDYVGGFAVTAGIGANELVARFENDHDDYNAIMTKALADRLAEALAEMLHREVRRSWYAPDESLAHDELIAEKYRGIRPAPGYPAQPDHTEKQTLFDLLQAERAGIELTESFAMLPAASVSGFYFAHPQARYFAVGKIGKDQVSDYAKRKGMPVAAMERWLAPILGYEPEEALNPALTTTAPVG